ncbi:MAG: AtpZ/AtpI family protein [Bacteroidetes bacterium]|nr:MAG: AtpZ/AtpI family protein [Bacteroidota bacterium]
MEKKDGDKKKNEWLIRFSNVGIQMGIVIAGFTWLGNYLDKRQQNETPIWTICLSLFGVFFGMYLIFKEVRKMNEDE